MYRGFLNMSHDHAHQTPMFAFYTLTYELFNFIITQSKNAQEEKEWNYSSSTARLSEFFHHKDN